MLVKVCGMRNQDNVDQVVSLGVDMIGFIFYPRSPRYISDLAPQTPPSVARAGVFVDESIDTIVSVARLNNLSHIQLHGSENPQMCHELRSRWQIIKAVPVRDAFDLTAASAYDGVCDLLLFDTKCEQHGGSGESFAWSLLDGYKGETPFILSGGIGMQNVMDIKQIAHPMLLGVDLNSRFEDEPAVKNIELLNQFIKNIK